MRALRKGAAGVLGFLGGIAIAVTISACCPQPRDVVWDILPGVDPIDERLTQYPLHGDTDYQVEVSADLSQAVETYKRNGKAYRAVYTLGPGSPNEMRSDTNLANE